MTRQTGFGLILPQANQVMVAELAALFPHSDIDVRRMVSMRRTSDEASEDNPEYNTNVINLGADIDAEASGIVFGCTTGGFWHGREGETDLVNAVQCAASRPVLSTARESVDAMIADKIRTPTVISPYNEMTNQRFAAYLSQFGILVKSWINIATNATTDRALITTMLQEKTEEAKATANDGLFIACSLIPTADIINELRSMIGRPVWSSITATARGIKLKLN